MKYLTLPQQVQKNKSDILEVKDQIENVGVGPQGETGPQGPTGIQGNTGPAGPDGTPVAGLSLDAVADATLGGYSLNISYGETGVSSTVRTYYINRSLSINTGSRNESINLYFDGVLQTEKVSTIDFFRIQTFGDAGTGIVRILFYDENGESVETINTALTEIKLNDQVYTFSLEEIVAGSTVGPTGPAGATGSQGATGPAGAQGIQGLPGVQNIDFLATYEHLDTFSGYSYRCMIQIVGGDYDGLTFIKETFTSGDVIKFGPYGSLVELVDVTSAVEVQLSLGVTSVRVYKVDNIT